MNNPLVSICVPTYEMKGKGLEFLSVLFDSVEKQTYKNIELIISDHSKNNVIEQTINTWKRVSSINIKYVKYTEKYNNGPANTNNCLKYVSGEYIKMLFQDDFFNYDYSLEKIITSMLEEKKYWSVSECIHCNEDSSTRFNHFVPHWNLKSSFTIDDYFNVFPRLGAPSLMTYKFNPKLKFNENVIMYMDVDFYYKLGKVYGEPLIINEQLIVDRNWSGQIGNSHGVFVDLNVEQKLIKDLYKNNEYKL